MGRIHVLLWRAGINGNYFVLVLNTYWCAHLRYNAERCIPAEAAPDKGQARRNFRHRGVNIANPISLLLPKGSY